MRLTSQHPALFRIVRYTPGETVSVIVGEYCLEVGGKRASYFFALFLYTCPFWSLHCFTALKLRPLTRATSVHKHAKLPINYMLG